MPNSSIDREESCSTSFAGLFYIHNRLATVKIKKLLGFLITTDQTARHTFWLSEHIFLYACSSESKLDFTK